MSKKKKILTVSITAFVLLIVPLITVFAIDYDGAFYLNSLGASMESPAKKLSYDYPVVFVENTNLSAVGKLAISISKKSLLGYSFKARTYWNMHNSASFNVFFEDYGSGTYKGTYVASEFTSGPLQGTYYMYSNSVYLGN